MADKPDHTPPQMLEQSMNQGSLDPNALCAVWIPAVGDHPQMNVCPPRSAVYSSDGDACFSVADSILETPSCFR